MKAFLRGWYSNKGLDKRKQPMQASRWVTPGTHLAMFLCTRHCSMQIGSERTNLEHGGLFCLTHKRPQLGITWWSRGLADAQSRTDPYSEMILGQHFLSFQSYRGVPGQEEGICKALRTFQQDSKFSVIPWGASPITKQYKLPKPPSLA